MDEQPARLDDGSINTINDCLVAVAGNGEEILIMTLGARLPRAKAKRLAAYLAVLTEWPEVKGEPSFEELVEAIKAT